MKKPKEDESIRRLSVLHDAFVAIKLTEMEIRFNLDAWLDKEEDGDVAGEIVDLIFESEQRLDHVEAAMKRVADLRQKGETWLRLFKTGH